MGKWWGNKREEPDAGVGALSGGYGPPPPVIPQPPTVPCSFAFAAKLQDGKPWIMMTIQSAVRSWPAAVVQSTVAPTDAEDTFLQGYLQAVRGARAMAEQPPTVPDVFLEA